MRVVIVRQDMPPGLEFFDGSLESMQELVGGLIQILPVQGLPHIDLVCCEEAVDKGYHGNGCGILGPYFFCRADDKGNSIGLTTDDVIDVAAFIKAHRDERHPAADYNEGKTDEPPAAEDLMRVIEF